MSFAEKVLSFYRTLEVNEKLPKGVVVLNPYKQEETFVLCRKFFNQYYSDDVDRTMIIGINPGRHGAGVTGIPFTDPVKLQDVCGIPNNLPKKTELSADFIHAMIKSFGGPNQFFSKFYFTSVSPLGFMIDGVNMNYYDSPVLAKRLRPFMIRSLHHQVTFGIHRQKAFCLGEGANYKFLKALNDEEKFFREIIPLAHPRFIMQYRRKMVDDYIEDYLSKLSATA
jgi:hypothetical protein